MDFFLNVFNLVVIIGSEGFYRGVKLSSPGLSPKGEQTNTGKYAGLVRFVCSHKAGGPDDVRMDPEDVRMDLRM